jgi:NADPH-dependent F420 reductase
VQGGDVQGGDVQGGDVQDGDVQPAERASSPPPAAGQLPDVTGIAVGILGGTGPQGLGLGRRLAMAGHPVVLGSRSAPRAVRAAAPFAAAGLPVSGDSNEGAALSAEVVLVTVPYEGHRTLLADLAPILEGKIVVDCVNPLGFDDRGAFALDVPAGSAAEEAAEVLPGARVVAAFHHLSATLLVDPAVERVEIDVLVLADDRDAGAVVAALAGRVPGMRGILAGRLRTARHVEALTANLIAINRRYRVHAGVRVTDL